MGVVGLFLDVRLSFVLIAMICSLYLLLDVFHVLCFVLLYY